MKWVNALNGLPETQKNLLDGVVRSNQLNLKVDGFPDVGTYYPDEERQFFACANQSEVLKEKDYHRIEWLYESPTQSQVGNTTQGEGFALRLLRDLYESLEDSGLTQFQKDRFDALKTLLKKYNL